MIYPILIVIKNLINFILALPFKILIYKIAYLIPNILFKFNLFILKLLFNSLMYIIKIPVVIFRVILYQLGLLVYTTIIILLVSLLVLCQLSPRLKNQVIKYSLSILLTIVGVKYEHTIKTVCHVVYNIYCLIHQFFISLTCL